MTAAIDLAALGQLPPLPSAYTRGEALDLLAPLRFLAPGEDPEGRPPEVDRRALATAMRSANEGYGHPAAREMAARLADPQTLVVVTGQQPGLFGGPLYTLSKAVTASRWAARLEAGGRPAVAVFWVATEDHDFTEVAQATVPGHEGLSRWSLGDDPSPLVPVGRRPLGASVDEVLEKWRAREGSESFSTWLDRLAAWHRPESRFGEAFCRTLVGMMGERCPLLLDAMLPEAKQAQQGGLLRLVEERETLDRDLAAIDARIESAGYALQVRPQPGMSPLFLEHEGERRRIEWRFSDRFALRGLDGFEQSVAWLERVIEDDPVRVSPGVLARPAFQDLVLGTYLQILGPGELAYMAQVAPTYELLRVEAPWTSLRPQVLVLSRRQRQQAEELELPLGELVGGGLDVSAVVSARAGEDFVTPISEVVERHLEGLEAPALALDRNLEKPLQKTRDQVRRALEAFGGRVAAAATRRHDVMTRRVEKLVETVRPGGTLQERAISGAHFVGRYAGFVEALWDQIDLDPRRLHLIDPERRDD